MSATDRDVIARAEDKTIFDRAIVRVLGAITVSAKIDGELAARLDAHVKRYCAEHGSGSRARIIRSALRYFLDAAEAELQPRGDVIEGSARDVTEGGS